MHLSGRLNPMSNRVRNQDDGPAAKRVCRSTRGLQMVDVKDWEALATKYKAHDETREIVIKRCRDMQKQSKNAIFSLHRGDFEGAAKQLSAAETLAKELLPTVTAAPSLRQGSFANACEEYAEALIFQVYLKESRVLQWKEVEWLTCDEYLGGLMDFTGELGRLAVAKATERDDASVSRYQELLDDLATRFMLLDPGNPGLRKKQGPLQATFAKLQRLNYELSLARNNPLVLARLQAAEPVVPAGGPAGDGEEAAA